MGSLPEEDKRRVFSPTPFPWPSLRGARIAIPQRGRGPPRATARRRGGRWRQAPASEMPQEPQSSASRKAFVESVK